MDAHRGEADSDDLGELRPRRRRCLDASRLRHTGYPSNLVFERVLRATQGQPLSMSLTSAGKDAEQAAKLVGVGRPLFGSAANLDDRSKLHPVARGLVKAFQKCSSGGSHAVEVSALDGKASGVGSLMVVHRTDETA